MDVEVIKATERRLLESICSFITTPEYTVFISELFPQYYAANGIEIHDPQGRSLAEWEKISSNFFDPQKFEHITYTFAERDDFAYLIEEAKAANYHVTAETYMFVDNLAHLKEVPANWTIREIKDAPDWERLRKFYNDFSKDYDWYDGEAGSDKLFQKTKFTGDAVGMQWFYISERGSDEMLAKLGIFQHGGICNLQDLGTAKSQRKKGLATALVSFAIKHALETLRTHGVALFADANYHAIDLYRKLGFEMVDSVITLMKYPVTNPDATGG